MSENQNYVLNVKTSEGYVELWGEHCDETKSIAGRLFHSPTIDSVYVGDKDGNHYLYLVKGHPEKREDVDSSLALYG